MRLSGARAGRSSATLALAVGLAATSPGCSRPADWPAFEPLAVTRSAPSARRLVLPSAYEAFLRGQVALTEGEFAEASRQLRAALRTDPDSAYLNAWIARAELGRERFEAARERLDAALAVDPCSELALCVAGEVLELTGQAEAAMRSYRRAIECEPREPEAYLLLADLLERLGSPARAEQVYLALAEVSPRPAHARDALARLALDRGDTETAARQLEALLADEPWRTEAVLRLARLDLEAGRTAQASALLRALVGREPRADEPRRLLAEALLAAGDTAGAARQISQLAVDPTRAPELAALAELWSRARRHREAADEARRALTLDPLLPEARLVLGAAERRLGQLDEALERLGGISGESEVADRASVERALALAETGREDGAVRTLRDRLASFPRSPRSRQLLAHLLRRGGELDEAADLLRSGESEDDALALAELLLEEGRAAEAEAALSALAAAPGASPRALALHALALVESGGDLARARAQAGRAAERARTDAVVQEARAATLLAAGELDGALGLLDRARSLAGGRPGPVARHAEALARAGRCEDARAAAAHAAALGPPRAAAGRIEAVARACPASE